MKWLAAHKKLSVGISAILLFIVALAIVANIPVPAAPKATISYHVDTAQLLSLTNQDRATAGVLPLTLDTNLSAAAMARCTDMAQNHYYSHTSPSGAQWSDAIKKYYKYYTLAGENIAQGQYTATTVNEAWLASPEHKANIIKPEFTLVGLASCPNGNQEDVVEEFMQPYVAPVSRTIANPNPRDLPLCPAYNADPYWNPTPGLDCF